MGSTVLTDHLLDQILLGQKEIIDGQRSAKDRQNQILKNQAEILIVVKQKCFPELWLERHKAFTVEPVMEVG